MSESRRRRSYLFPLHTEKSLRAQYFVMLFVSAFKTYLFLSFRGRNHQKGGSALSSSPDIFHVKIIYVIRAVAERQKGKEGGGENNKSHCHGEKHTHVESEREE